MIQRIMTICINLLHSEYFMTHSNDRHFQKDMNIQSIRWYLTYAISYEYVEELMEVRGLSVDYDTRNR